MSLEIVTDGEEGSLDTAVKRAFDAIEIAATRAASYSLHTIKTSSGVKLPYTTLVRATRTLEQAYDLFLNGDAREGFDAVRSSLMDAREFWRLLPVDQQGPMHTEELRVLFPDLYTEADAQVDADAAPAPDFDSLLAVLDISGSEYASEPFHTLDPLAFDPTPIWRARDVVQLNELAAKCAAYDAMLSGFRADVARRAA